jgi:hypothetical protein
MAAQGRTPTYQEPSQGDLAEVEALLRGEQGAAAAGEPA